MASNPIVWRVKVKNVIYDIRSIIENQLGALATKNKATLTNASDVEGTLPVANGGTGRATLTANRILTGAGTNAVGMIQTQSGAFYATGDDAAAKFGTLPVAQGGTGATSAASARDNLGVVQTSYDTLTGTTLTAESNVEYNAGTLASLKIIYPSNARGTIFGVNFTSSNTFSGVTFQYNGSNITSSVKLSGDSLSMKSKRYNLICWYDGNSFWCAAKAA